MKNDWGLIYNITHPRSANRIRVNEKESFAVKLCPKCNRVYEIVRNQYQQASTTHYYKDFPRRGLYDQVCFTCK